jgi:diguanylate cyclase (GGDEF)-like protein
VFCLDLDGFKGVNDRLGHATGDAVLVAVASRLRTSVRDTDFVCRLGGDEFVILLPNIMPGEIEAVARRIITQVSEPFEFAPAARVGVSIGIASVPHDGVSADELLSAADRAMYDAKRRGKGGFAFYASVAETVTLAPSADADAGFAAALSPDLADSAALAR